MKKIFFIICLVGFGFSMTAQQEYGMHFMRDVWNSNYTNPGLSPYQTFFIGGTSLGASLSLKGLGNTPIFLEEADGRFAPNYQGIIDYVSDDVRIRNNISAELFSVGFKAKKLFFSLNATTKANMQIGLPANIFQLAWYGNEAFIGEELEFGPSFSFDAYQELGLGINYSFNRKMSAGIRVKRLTGIVSVATASHQLSLETGEDYYQTIARTNYVANISSPFLDIVAPFDGKLLNTRAELNQSALDDITQNYQFPQGNAGWGIDLGASLNIKDRIEISASVLDLGFINWTNGVSGLQTSGTFQFDGLELSEAANNGVVSFSPVYDSIQNLLVISSVPGTEFRKNLSPKIYLSALAKYGYWQLGGMLYNEFSQDGIVSSVGLSGRYVRDNRFSLGAVYAYHDGRFDNLGVNGTLRLGPLQLHLLVDNVLFVFRPDHFEYTNIRAGANIVFGTKKMKNYRKGRSDTPAPPENPETR